MRNHVSSPVMRIVVPGATEHERKTHMTLAHDLVTSTSRSVLRGRGKDAMMTDNDDLGHLTHGLELDNVVNDLPHSRPALDDHHLALEGHEMQEDFNDSFILEGREMHELSSTTSMIAPDELAKKARKRSNKPHPGSTKVARTLAVVITLAFSQPDSKHSLFVWGVPLGSVSVFAKDGRLYTNHTHHSPSTVTVALTFPTHSFVSFPNGLGCTLLQHTTSHALPTLPPPSPKTACLWGVHWHRTDWRLIATVAPGGALRLTL